MTEKEDLITKRIELEKKLSSVMKKFKKSQNKLKFLKNLDKKEIENLLTEYKNNLLEILFVTNVLTKDEYHMEYKNKYIDEWGFDGFIQYVDCLFHQILGKEKIAFVTLNKKMLKDRAFLEEKFGVEILSPEEAVEGRKTTYFIGE